MSECKHGNISCVGKVNIWRCNDCGHEEPNIDELQEQVKEREREIEQIEVKCCQCHTEHVAQVAVLRGALEAIVNTTSHKRAVQLAIRFIAATPAEAAERVQKLAELLQDAVSETENGERLSKGFCSAAKAALSEWRSDKCSA